VVASAVPVKALPESRAGLGGDFATDRHIRVSIELANLFVMAQSMLTPFGQGPVTESCCHRLFK
jgi:hypothetical protein